MASQQPIAGFVTTEQAIQQENQTTSSQSWDKWISDNKGKSFFIALIILYVIYSLFYSDSGGSSSGGMGGPISMLTGATAGIIGLGVGGVKGIADVAKSKAVSNAGNTVVKGTDKKVIKPIAKSANKTGDAIKKAFKF